MITERRQVALHLKTPDFAALVHVFVSRFFYAPMQLSYSDIGGRCI